MKKNVASQLIGAQLVSATDGSGITSGAAIGVCGDAAGSFTTGGGTLTHIANGYWQYAPTQAETNFAYAAYQFTATGAVSVTQVVYTTFPQTGDAFAVAGTLTSINGDANAASNLAKTTAAVLRGTVTKRRRHDLRPDFRFHDGWCCRDGSRRQSIRWAHNPVRRRHHDGRAARGICADQCKLFVEHPDFHHEHNLARHAIERRHLLGDLI